MIRAFVGVKLDSLIIQRMAALAAQLKLRLPEVRWVPGENLHFTLKFLGEIEEEQISSIANTLDGALRPFPRFAINAKGVGVFPDLKRARVLWVGLERDNLGKLASRVDTALESLGFARETRAFAPHLTIGRWRQAHGSPAELGKQLEQWKAYEFGSSTVEQVILFQSVLDRHGATYHPLKVFPLNRELVV